MANEEHLTILNQGVPIWNDWRRKNLGVRPDLRKAKLQHMTLIGANLSYADLSGTDLSEADLSKASLSRANLERATLVKAQLRRTNLVEADLRWANLRRASLQGADLRRASLIRANLYRADLENANLSDTNFSDASLHGANLCKATLRGTNLRGAVLHDASLSDARIGWVVFGSVDLSRVQGLESVQHQGPSSVGIDTIQASHGDIAESFLFDAGVPDTFIEFSRTLTVQTIEFYSCFISYSSRDQLLTERLHGDLQSHRVRCWYAPENMKIGERIRPRIDESIRLHDKLLLVLSEHSVASAWVEQEVETALDRERRHGKTVLFPIRLDDAVMEIESGWPALIRNTRHIGDFTRWKEHDAYQAAFERLLRDLKAEGD